MEFLRITATDGTRKYIPDNYVVQISVAADVEGSATANASGRIQRGLITDLKYLDGIAAAQPSIVVVAAIPAYTGANVLYEYGCHSPDGAFIAAISNRSVNY